MLFVLLVMIVTKLTRSTEKLAAMKSIDCLLFLFVWSHFSNYEPTNHLRQPLYCSERLTGQSNDQHAQRDNVLKLQ